MRQVMPHRNNIDVHRTKCKRFFGGRAFRGAGLAFLSCSKWKQSQLRSSIIIRKQCFMKTVGIIVPALSSK